MDKINFENLPSTNTPINAENLNQMQDNVENAIIETQTNLENVISEIIESGSNDNGSYIKYANGDMICRKTVLGTVDITNTTMGNAFYYGEVNLGDFPVNFIERPTINVSPQTQSGTQYFLAGSPGGSYGSATSWGRYSLLRPTSRTGVDYILDAVAIGKWK